MTDTYDLLKNELRVYYPGVTDVELNQMTRRLIEFFTIAAKAVYETEKAEGIAKELTNDKKNDLFP